MSEPLQDSSDSMGLSDHGGHGGEEEGEAWLISYADLMTLLFGLFAMLFTFATFDDDNMIRIDKRLAHYFGGSHMASPEKVAKDVKVEMGKLPYYSSSDLKVTDDGFELSFISSLLFTQGGTELDPASLEPLKVLSEVLRVAGGNYLIRVEGHTDDTPMRGKIPSNWELSALRASSVVRTLQGLGFAPASLQAIGMGDSRPLLPNRDEKGVPILANQLANRRVVIKVIIIKETKGLPKRLEDKGPSDAQPASS